MPQNGSLLFLAKRTDVVNHVFSGAVIFNCSLFQSLRCGCCVEYGVDTKFDFILIKEFALSAACPGVDFTVPYKHSPSYFIGEYVIEFLLKTFDIIKSSPNIKNEVIVDFFKAETKDHLLPFTKDYLFKNLRCSDTFSDDSLSPLSLPSLLNP